jgi:hypothetical protein
LNKAEDALASSAGEGSNTTSKMRRALARRPCRGHSEVRNVFYPTS